MAKVLLVEDSPTQARVVKGALEKTQYDVEHSDRMSDAIALAAGGQIDVILLDLHLPDSEGLNTYLRMQESAPNTPIVVLTSTDDEELALQMLRSGAQDYLIKGEVTADWIVRAVRYAIERFSAFKIKQKAPQKVAHDRELSLGIEKVSDINILRVREKQLFGDDLIEQLSSQLFKLVDEQGQRKFLLDCNEVEYLSNSVLGQLLVWDKKIRQHRGNLRICNLRKEVQDQIKARKLLAQFDIFLDEPTARAGF